jgi:hypothetical protein
MTRRPPAAASAIPARGGRTAGLLSSSQPTGCGRGGAQTRANEPGTHPVLELSKGRPPRPFRSPHTRRPARHSPLPYCGRAGARRARPPRPPLFNPARPPRPRPRRRGGPGTAQPAPAWAGVPSGRARETNAHPPSSQFPFRRTERATATTADTRAASFVNPSVS